MGYSVYRFHDGDVLEPVSGLTLNEAFTRMMALAHCGYRFYRDGSVMRLEITQLDPPTDEELRDPYFIEEYYPDYRSTLADNEMARLDIMRRFLTRGMNGHLIREDSDFRRHQIKAALVEQSSVKNPLSPSNMRPAKWRDSE